MLSDSPGKVRRWCGGAPISQVGHVAPCRREARTCLVSMSHLEFAASVELLQFPLRGVHVGEAGGFAQHPGVLQRLLHAQALVRVLDDQLADLQTQSSRLTPHLAPE